MCVRGGGTLIRWRAGYRVCMAGRGGTTGNGGGEGALHVVCDVCGGPLHHEGGAVEEGGEALHHEGGAVEEGGGALHHEGGAVEEGGGALHHEGGAVEEGRGALHHEGRAVEEEEEGRSRGGLSLFSQAWGHGGAEGMQAGRFSEPTVISRFHAN